MENQEKIQDVLSSFQKSPSKDIPLVLEDYLRTVAKTGKTVFPWQQLKLLFVQKIEQVMEQFHKEDPCDHHAPFPNVENAKHNEMRQRIVDAFQRFNGAPFTVQRICELVTQPKKHYTQCDKFLRGIEKNVMVVSTVDPCGRKIVSESRGLVNGLDTNGHNAQQQNDVNDVTDGQPFVPMPVADWNTNEVATVWQRSAGLENKNNSNVASEETNKVEQKTVEATSESKANNSIDSGLSGAGPESESGGENELVVKDSDSKIEGTPVSLSEETQGEDDQSENQSENAKTCSDSANRLEDIKGEKSEAGNQSSEVPLAGKKSCDSVSQSEESMEDGERGSEKHGLDDTSAEESEPPEKKLKSCESSVSDSVQSQEPVVNQSQVPAQETSASTQEPDQSISASDTHGSDQSDDGENCESKITASNNTEDMEQQDGGSQSEATKQSTTEMDQSENRLQNTATASGEQNLEGSNSTETVSDRPDSEEKKTEEEHKQVSEDDSNKTVDSSSTAELMDTESAPEKSESAKNQTVDESEPMDQE